MRVFFEKGDIESAKFHEKDLSGETFSSAYRRGWNEAIEAILENARPYCEQDLSICKPVKIRYRGNSKTISGYLDETRNIVFTQALTVELLGSAGFSVEIEEEQLRDGGSEE